jgi:hypothetical protein
MQRSGIREIAPWLPRKPRIPLRFMPGYGHRLVQKTSTISGRINRRRLLRCNGFAGPAC